MKPRLSLALFLALVPAVRAEVSVEIPVETEMTSFEEAVAENLGAPGVPLNSVAIVRVREPKKTLGKGLADRKTGERMQLACIGERLGPASPERKCDLLRFLYATAGGEEFLVGPAFALHDGDKTGVQMKKAFHHWKVSKKVDQRRSFMVTRMLYGQFFDRTGTATPNPSSNTRAGLQIGIIAAQGFGCKLLMAGATTTGVALAGYIAGSLLAPVILDLAILPITAILDRKNAKNTWGFSGKDLNQLQSRSVPAWQLKPAKTRTKRFQILLRSLLRVNHVAGAAEGVFPSYYFYKNGGWMSQGGKAAGGALSDVNKTPVKDIIANAQEEATLLLSEAGEE